MAKYRGTVYAKAFGYLLTSQIMAMYLMAVGGIAVPSEAAAWLAAAGLLVGTLIFAADNAMDFN